MRVYVTDTVILLRFGNYQIEPAADRAGIMSEVFTDFGKVEYEPAWLEQKLEEYLASEGHLLALARKIDMSDWPCKVHMCRYLIGSQHPFDAVIYNKELVTEHYNKKLIGEDDISLATVDSCDDMVKSLKKILENPEYLQEEVTRFVLVDGIVTLRHEHRGRKTCDTCDESGFTVSWGGGDLSTCPCVVRDEEKRYHREGTVRGRAECIYALNAVMKEGGLF
jgi:hypothetical protein